MIIKKIIVNNYASYKHEVIEFDKLGNSPYLLCGNNGSGKTTIIEMITTVLFNRCRGVDQKGTGMDELIHTGCDSFKIELEFILNDINYIIIRERNRKSQKLKLFINGEDKSGKLMETQQMINNIIKLDYDSFMDTVIIAQGQSASFMNKPPIERKKVIAQILDLNKYDILENYTKDVKKDLKSILTIQDNEINELFNIIKNKEKYLIEITSLQNDIIDIGNKIDKLENDLESELTEKAKYDELKKQQSILINRKNTIINNIEKLKNNIILCKKSIDDFSKKIKLKEVVLNDIEIYTKNIEELQNKLTELGENKASLNTENGILQANINELKNKAIKLKDYNEATCEFCGQNITHQYKEKHLKQMFIEAKGYKNILDKNNEKLTNINNLINDSKNKLNSLRMKLNKLNNDKIEIIQGETKLENYNNKLIELQERLEQENQYLIEINGTKIVNLENKIFKDTNIKNNLNQLRYELTNKSNRLSILENEIKKIEKNEVEYKKIKFEYDYNKKLFSNYELLQKAWSKNGIQALIIDNILPKIENEINKYLNILSNGEIFIKFETQKIAKNGNLNETLDIIVSDSNGSRPYERYSGGQRTRIDFAFHIGLAKFLTKQSGTNIDFFVIDEGLGTLDSDGRDSVLEMIQNLNSIFKQIFIISHIDDIKESFSTKILVTNNKDEGSKVNLLK